MLEGWGAGVFGVWILGWELGVGSWELDCGHGIA